jgi:biopolymer transport protein ExbD
MGARIGGGDDDLAEMHEINVTPFIDVMLVLLIVFMVAAPLATADIPVDLPVAEAAPQPRPPKPLFLTVRADLGLAIGEQTLAPDRLADALDEATGGDRKQRIFLRADKAVPWGDLMEVMNRLRRAGYLALALVGREATPTPR